MPVAAVKIGRMWPNNPESWVDVVELSVIESLVGLRRTSGQNGDEQGNITDHANDLSTGAPWRRVIQAISANQPWFIIISLLNVDFIVVNDLPPARDLAV